MTQAETSPGGPAAEPAPAESFVPSGLLRNRHIQSALASVAWRGRLIRRQDRELFARTRETLLDCGEGVRLQGFFTPAEPGLPVRGLAVLLHGWEGSSDSNYILSLTRQLVPRGYEVLRLNFRDHGETHHLNPELFHSCRLPEVIGALRAIAATFETRPLLLAGFSLGGNFALRIALRAPQAAIPLAHAVAVSPVIEPASCLAAIESGPRVYERRFLDKWSESLRIKQRAWPGRYDFAECLKIGRLRPMTDYLVRRYGGFASLSDYMDGYSIAGERLADLQVPSTIVTAADDPIIPVEDFGAMVRPACLTLEIQSRGGHCGFIESVTLRSWIDRRIDTLFADVA